ncbi:MAG: hypothetical protein HGGPFJEG_00094 [Ignavibacteria bacterium]|nr:hypothetical protein [Ignavibacteria bacterium]
MEEKIRGRGSQFNLKNRFEKLSLHDITHELDEYFDTEDFERAVKTEFFNDISNSVLTKNESPDLGAGYSINPYRGCEHGCIYCYARPTHEYLGFSPGLDFETKIMVKRNAPELLKKEFLKKCWIPQTVFFSGNTDCYQPIEKQLEITRKCLEIFLKFRNPVAVITKNALIRRDTDILKRLSELNLVRVIISITTLNKDLQRRMEPRTSTPSQRLKTIEFLSGSEIPTGVNVAPIIPGLTDEEIPEILKNASGCGAQFAAYVMLRLPFSTKELFTDWLGREFPDRAKKVINRVTEIHGGKLYNSEFGRRLTGEGNWAEAVKKIFEFNCNKTGLNKNKSPLSKDLFRRENPDQESLF